MERDLITLLARLGSLGIPNPTATSPTEHKASLQVTASLVDAIIEWHGQFNNDTIAQQQQCKVKVRQEKREAHLATFDTYHPVSTKTPETDGCCKGERLIWLVGGTSYWEPQVHTPQKCFPWRYLFKVWMAATTTTNNMCLWYVVYHRSCSELSNRRVSNHTPQWSLRSHSRFDVRGMPCCVCGTCPPTAHRRTIITCHSQQRGISLIGCESMRILETATAECIFDVRLFNPCAPSCWGTQMDACYRRHEREKCQAYEQHVREVEQGSFTPLAFITSGGMGRAATVTYKRLASLLATKRELRYTH